MITIYPHGTFAKGFTVEGHADYAEHGRDIVCASVSVVTQMVAYEFVRCDIATCLAKNGRLDVNINVEKDIHYVSRVLVMMLNTLEEIQKQYPEYIQIKEEY